MCRSEAGLKWIADDYLRNVPEEEIFTRLTTRPSSASSSGELLFASRSDVIGSQAVTTRGVVRRIDEQALDFPVTFVEERSILDAISGFRRVNSATSIHGDSFLSCECGRSVKAPRSAAEWCRSPTGDRQLAGSALRRAKNPTYRCRNNPSQLGSHLPIVMRSGGFTVHILNLGASTHRRTCT